MEQYNEIKITYNYLNYCYCRCFEQHGISCGTFPHTSLYAKIIHQAVQDKDADEALRHIDTKSIVKNILEREGNKIYRYI